MAQHRLLAAPASCGIAALGALATFAAVVPTAAPVAAQASPAFASGANVNSSGPAGGASNRIAANDNRQYAGSLQGGVLTLRLEVREGVLHPEDDEGPGIPALAFAEVGRAPQVPGPLIRVPAGTEVRVSVHNPVPDSTITVYGLHAHPAAADSGLRVPAGATREVRFRAATPGTYFYWGALGHRGMDDRIWLDSQLSGAIVVDAPGAPTDDRVFVMGIWFRPGDSTLAVPQPTAEVMVINGRSWPHTERITQTEGDSVRWRWVNASSSSHPMHLHGFYFHLESRGDWLAERTYEGDRRPFLVTNLMLPGETMRIAWVPERPGNWLFHCHFTFHVSHHLVLPRDLAATPAAATPASHAVHGAHASGDSAPAAVVPHQMAGLVMGIHVNPRRGGASVVRSASTVRDIRLLAQTAPRRFGKLAGMGYVTHEGAAPARDSVMIPGPLLVLRRGEPVRFTVVNHLDEPTAVHWHGIELESFPDGVPGWSGAPGRIMPPIAPADSFIAEFVPPRAGTFIYHTHSNEQLQMGGGLYGALLVVDPATPFDPAVDKVILLGGGGPSDSLPQFDFQSPGLVNGSPSPPPLDMKVGTTYRLRFININPDWRVIFSLTTEDALARWTPVAKDGADLPAVQRAERSAWLLTGPGETADFEFTPAVAGDLRLEVKTQLPGWIIPMQVRVR